MNKRDFWHAYINSKKRKRWFVNFQLDVIKNTCSQSNFEILKSAISQEQQGQSA